MNPNDIWALPKIPAAGDEDEEALYSSVGRALSEWERFENLLAFLFAAFIIPKHDSEAARRAYGSVVSFGGRADLLKGAAGVYFRNFHHTVIEDEFDSLIKIARRASTQRNNIAHGVVLPFLIRQPHPKPMQFALFPSYYRTNKHDVHGMPDYAFSKAIIDRFREQFSKLQEPLISVARAVTGEYVWQAR
jgi:hypothetical protein